jgi:hypothetical protein
MRPSVRHIPRLPALAGLLGIALLAGGAGAQVNSHDAEIVAATEQAADNLYQSLRVEPIAPRLTIADLLTRDDGDQSLIQLLRSAQLVGGPRWISASYCQVRIQISGDAIAKSLEQSAAARAAALGAPLASIDARLSMWNGRVFSSTGASACGDAVLDLLPSPDNDAWATVPTAQRVAAIAAARAGAADVVLSSVAPVPLADGVTLGDALQWSAAAPNANPQAIATANSTTGPTGDATCVSVVQWLEGRPVIRVDFESDRVVDVKLFVDGADLASELQTSLKANATGPLPVDDAGWSNFTRAVIAHMAQPLGRAAVSAPQTPSAPPSWTSAPPAWIGRSLTAQAAAPAGAPQLIAARQSEDLAMVQLQTRVRALPLYPHTTIGQAVDHDPKLAAALARAMQRAQVYQANYRDDGTVLVAVALDLRGVWEELAAAAE